MQTTPQINLEHVNLTVRDPQETANILVALFDWKIRWSGTSMDDGFTAHVGTDSSYLALYSNDHLEHSGAQNHSVLHNLNHIAVVVPDLETVLAKVEANGFEAFNFGDYEPGKRFYFYLQEKLEVEVVSYS